MSDNIYNDIMIFVKIIFGILVLALIIYIGLYFYRRFIKTVPVTNYNITIVPFELTEFGNKGPPVTSQNRAPYTEYITKVSSPENGPLYGIYELDGDAV